MKIMGQLILTDLTPEEEMRLNLLCASTRSKRDMANLMREFPNLSRSNNTVFGEFGDQGEYLIPDIRYFMDVRPLLPCGQLIDPPLEILRFNTAMDMQTKEEDVGVPPADCPYTILPFRFSSVPGKLGSYLVWYPGIWPEQDFDVYSIILWLSNVLQKMGHKFLGGKLGYIYNNVRCSIYIDGNGDVVKMERPGKTIKGKDYQVFYNQLDPQPSKWAVIYAPEILRNIERFTGPNINNEDAIYDDSLWELEESMSGFAGTVSAFSAEEALTIASKEFKCKKKHLTVLKLA